MPNAVVEIGDELLEIFDKGPSTRKAPTGVTDHQDLELGRSNSADSRFECLGIGQNAGKARLRRKRPPRPEGTYLNVGVVDAMELAPQPVDPGTRTLPVKRNIECHCARQGSSLKIDRDIKRTRSVGHAERRTQLLVIDESLAGVAMPQFRIVDVFSRKPPDLDLLARQAAEDQTDVALLLMPARNGVLDFGRRAGEGMAITYPEYKLAPFGVHLLEPPDTGRGVRKVPGHFVEDELLGGVHLIVAFENELRLSEDADPREMEQLHTPGAFGERVRHVRWKRDQLIGEGDHRIDVEPAGDIRVALDLVGSDVGLVNLCFQEGRPSGISGW